MGKAQKGLDRHSVIDENQGSLLESQIQIGNVDNDQDDSDHSSTVSQSRFEIETAERTMEKTQKELHRKTEIDENQGSSLESQLQMNSVEKGHDDSDYSTTVAPTRFQIEAAERAMGKAQKGLDRHSVIDENQGSSLESQLQIDNVEIDQDDSDYSSTVSQTQFQKETADRAMMESQKEQVERQIENDRNQGSLFDSRVQIIDTAEKSQKALIETAQKLRSLLEARFEIEAAEWAVEKVQKDLERKTEIDENQGSLLESQLQIDTVVQSQDDSDYSPTLTQLKIEANERAMEIAQKKEVERQIQNDRNQRSLFEARLKIEKAEMNLKVLIENEQKQRFLLETRFEIEANERARVNAQKEEVEIQIENVRNQRSLFEPRLQSETADKNLKALIEIAQKQRSLLETRFEIEAAKWAMEKAQNDVDRKTEIDKNKRSSLESHIQVKTVEKSHDDSDHLSTVLPTRFEIEANERRMEMAQKGLDRHSVIYENQGLLLESQIQINSAVKSQDDSDYSTTVVPTRFQIEAAERARENTKKELDRKTEIDENQGYSLESQLQIDTVEKSQDNSDYSSIVAPTRFQIETTERARDNVKSINEVREPTTISDIDARVLQLILHEGNVGVKEEADLRRLLALDRTPTDDLKKKKDIEKEDDDSAYWSYLFETRFEREAAERGRKKAHKEEVERQIENDHSRLKIETAEMSRMVQIDNEKKQRSAIEALYQIEAAERAMEKAQKELDRQIVIDQNQRSLLEARLKIETAEKSRKALIDNEQKHRSLLETRFGIEANERAREKAKKEQVERQIENDRNQRSLFNSRLQIETAEKSRKALIEIAQKQRSLLETRFEIEATERATEKAERERQIENDRNQMSLFDSRLKRETEEKIRNTLIENEQWQRSLLETRFEIEASVRAREKTQKEERERQVLNHRNQRSLFECRLKLETAEMSQKTLIETAQKQRSLLETRFEIETVEWAMEKAQNDEVERQILNHRNQRSLLEARFKTETAEKSRKALIENEQKQRSLLETRFEIEAAESAMKNAQNEEVERQIENDRDQRSLFECRLKIETAEMSRKALIEIEQKQGSLLETRFEIEAAEMAFNQLNNYLLTHDLSHEKIKRQVENNQNQRTSLEARLRTETVEKSPEVLFDNEEKQMSLLEFRFEIEAADMAIESAQKELQRMILNDRNQGSLSETWLKIDTAEKNRKALISNDQKRTSPLKARFEREAAERVMGNAQKELKRLTLNDKNQGSLHEVWLKIETARKRRNYLISNEQKQRSLLKTRFEMEAAGRAM